MAQMNKSRMPLMIGLAAAGGVGYYLYKAGGDTKSAGRKFESDLDKAAGYSNPDNSPKAEKELKGYGQEAGAKIDHAVSEADKQASRLKQNTESYARDAKHEALKGVDKFDQKVEEGASKAKGWFGGSK